MSTFFQVGIAILIIVTGIACAARNAVSPHNANSIPASTSTPIPSETVKSPVQIPTSTLTVTPAITPTVLAIDSSIAKRLSIAFISNGQIGLWHNGTTRRLHNAHPADDGWGRVALADDGQMIAFVSQGALWAINSDGTHERRLVSAADFKSMPPLDPGVSLLQFDWAPNTHKLLFNTRLNTSYGLNFADDLYLVDADTQQWVNLLPPNQGGDFHFSPDGRKVALVSPSQIRLMDADGRNARTLLDFPAVSTASEFSHYPLPVWSPTSDSLRLALLHPDAVYDSTLPTTIWHLPVDGTKPFTISKISTQGIYISPNLTHIAYPRFITPASTYGDFPLVELHLADIDGSNDFVYASGKVGFVNWLPDSDHFVFWQERDNDFYRGQISNKKAILLAKIWFLELPWIDESHFLFYDGVEPYGLKLGTVGHPALLLIEPPVADYDFILK
ncbi:MAG: hypothetical protein KDI02_09450 [Anaerolineae bacterium]|nr:hypothetical protein [Anaerolineae bacterium]MCB9105684.1 hypothetical protein [Anaerolineales bacterium]